ncbi:hypothetical protein [Bifidobacterium phasiani]|uniref:YbjN domain-containing protein n=1 Tax=Bifidobacterium phasiani TaxID=2834431 RepID=A0ABS6W805_9BIFI|nr:hypothetical protein [Bifidobacterium phasiani]MBW3082624.1 hypothetical protein [Bifidobacterium phasiani]
MTTAYADSPQPVAAPDADSARAREVWTAIKRRVKAEYRRVFASDDEGDEPWMMQYAVRNGADAATIRVVYEPDVHSVQIRVIYPFEIPADTLPFAQAYVCAQAYDARFVAPRLADDGEIICGCVVPFRPQDEFPLELFCELLRMAAHVGLRHYGRLRAYAEGELGDDEVARFLEWLPQARALLERRANGQQEGGRHTAGRHTDSQHIASQHMAEWD